ncbi:CPBP family intramembrane metalloprotease [Candidatus Saccharibacteria bacterium]|nr:CPBP family intramembrane metalloprotease [Candidatus Saccharibacteria bacterium]
MRFAWHYYRVTLFYLAITVASYALYHYLQHLPEASGVMSAGSLWQQKGSVTDGLRSVWLIFAWGFGVQALIQVVRVFERKPRDANLPDLLRHGAYLSAHAGLFEEIVFRLYAFLSFIIILHYLNDHVWGGLQSLATGVILPAANWLTLGVFHGQFNAANWALGLAVIIGSLFFRSAHVHYGYLSKLNVWIIGLVMFWLTLNYGLITAIIAHFLYDFCVFAAIALTAPLQPRAVE